MAVSTIKGGKETALVKGNYIPSDGWQLTKIGNIVFCFITNITSMPSGAFSSPNAIPEGFRPKPFANKTISVRASVTRQPLAVGFKEDGSIGFYNYGAAIDATASINETIAWPIV